MKKVFAWAIIAIILIVLLVLVVFNSNRASDKIKIGVITPISGDLAFLGENIVRSAEIAIEDLGYTDRVELIIEDGGNVGGGRESISAYRKLVDIDGVQFIIDGMSSDGTMSVAPLIDKDKVVMITPVTGGENVDNAAEYLFRNGPSDVLAGTLPADDFNDRFEYSKIALFTDNAEYSLDIAKHFRNNYKGEIVIDELIAPDKSDYRAELTKILGKDYDAFLILTASGSSAAYMIKQIDEMNIDKPIFSNFMAFNQNTVEIAGSSLEGVYIYDVDFDESSQEVQRFFIKYEIKYGNPPPIKFHATGTYDAVRMGLEAIEAAGYDGQEIHDYLLENVLNWKGLNGEVSFDSKGNVQAGFVLKRVENGELVIVE